MNRRAFAVNIRCRTVSRARRNPAMIKKRILFLTTTRDFLGKFEQGNVKILQNKGFEVHYAANMQEPHYPIDEEKLKALDSLI